MNRTDPLTDRLRELCSAYAAQGSSVPRHWYAEVADLRKAAQAARRPELVHAIDALPTSDFKSPYWVL